ncbi:MULTISPECIES: hypothetical protein [Streptomyces]|uniref:hypothetical protein n=1 Tax=Streptomyces TaxID=1883 RepID=UPI00117EA6EA|nr:MULTISPECIES: hypothetical protein [Streptomyces]
MTAPRIDYRALFAATPSPYLVLGPDLVIIDVNLWSTLRHTSPTITESMHTLDRPYSDTW